MTKPDHRDMIVDEQWLHARCVENNWKHCFDYTVV